MKLVYGDRKVTVTFEGNETPADFAKAVTEIVWWIRGDVIDVRLVKNAMTVTLRDEPAVMMR